jgi:hypothetical protein
LEIISPYVSLVIVSEIVFPSDVISPTSKVPLKEGKERGCYGDPHLSGPTRDSLAAITISPTQFAKGENMKISNLTLKYAQKYTRWGWRVVPVPAKEKAARRKGWQKLRLKKCDLAKHFSGGGNIGVLLGEPSKHLIDVDLDCDQAVFLASTFLPATERIHGRKSKPRSHWYYYGQAGLKPEKFEDTDGKCLLEVRSIGQQTIIPPSIHPSGERLRWAVKGKPSAVSNEVISRVAEKLAATCLVARHWPSIGSRNDAALALAGFLLGAGWPVEETEEFISNVAHAAHDEELKSREAAARRTQETLSKNLPVTGGPRLNDLIGKKVMDRIVKWLRIQVPLASDAKISAKPNRWPKPLHENAFYGLAGQFIKFIEPETEADQAALLVQFLVAFGNMVGPSPHFNIEGTHQGTNLFCLIVGRSAKARKGTAWAHIRRLFWRVDTAWADNAIASNLSSGEGIIWAVRNSDKAGSRKSKEQDLEDLDRSTDKRLLAVQSEFASVLRMQRREGNILSQIIRQAWDSGTFRILTKKDPVETKGAHISIIGHVTNDELQREMSQTDGASGYANRFLFVAAERKRLLPLGGRIDERAMQPLVLRLRQAKVFGKKAFELVFSPKAEKLWIASYPRLTADIPGLLGAVTGRAEAQVLRLAVIYALLNQSIVIRVPHLRAAIAVWRYCARSARYIFGGSLGNKRADQILTALRKEPRGLSRTKIRRLFAGNLDAKEIERALAFLVKYKLASCTQENTNGRPREIWRAS